MEDVPKAAGTLGYIAPESYADAPIAWGVDLWALGCIMYEMLFAFPPFGESSMNVTCLLPASVFNVRN
jgi:serine/threonine protein kinase